MIFSSAWQVPSTKACGIPAGPISVNQVSTSKPGPPASAIVGRSGNPEDRLLPVTASARIRRDWMCGIAVGMLSIMNCTCPDSRSVIAGPPPL